MVIHVLVSVCGLFLIGPSLAQSLMPQPRVTYAMHTASIRQIRATPDWDRLASIGQDKTIRVWRTEDLKLLRTIYLPSEDGDEGDPRSLAITADGKEVIVGGYTGLSWKKQSQLYRFDLATGRLLETIRGFKGSIESLAISRDGRLLAVGSARQGVTVIGSSDKQTIFSDENYVEQVTFIDFSVDGKMATTSADGCARIYAPDGKILFRAEWPVRPDAGNACKGSSSLGGIRFSPDGRWLAFGVQDRPEVVLMNAQTLTMHKVIKVEDPKQRSLCCIAWSPDSKLLYINGVNDSSEPTPLYRISDSGSGNIERLPVGRNFYTNMLPLPGGDIIFSTDTPSLVRLRAVDGKLVAETLPPNGDFRSSSGLLRVSHDGRRVMLPMQADGGDVKFFDTSTAPDRAYRQSLPTDLVSTQAALRMGAVSVETETGVFSYKQPTRVNGNALQLRPFQSIWSWATHATVPVAAIGTGWTVLLADDKGKIKWQHTVQGTAHHVSISGDGKWVVAAIGDGTLRWFSVESGKEALGLFMHVNGEDWVSWRPDGYYASSPRGDEYIGWLINRGDEHAPDFYRAVQFERQLYRPDLVQLALSPVQTPSTAEPLQRLLAGLAPPRVTIEQINKRDGEPLEVKFTAESNGRPMREIGIYADGIPVMSASERRLDAATQNRVSRSVRLPAGTAPDTIRVEVETDVSVGSDETSPSERLKPLAIPRGKLFLVAIGVKAFLDTRNCSPQRPCKVRIDDLPNAPNDAEVLAQRMKLQTGKQYDSVETFVLTDNTTDKPTKQNILTYLKHLEQAGPKDTTILFLASHGFSQNLSASEYYMTPRDAKLSDIETILNQNSAEPVPASKTPSLLTASEIYAAFRHVAGRRLLIVDTCHAGAVDGRQNPYSLAKRSAAAQLAVLSAASGDELSYEAVDASHGAFTRSLLDALDGGGDLDRDGFVTLREAFEFIRPRIADNSRRLTEQTRSQRNNNVEIKQTPTLTSIPVIERSILSRVEPTPR